MELSGSPAVASITSLDQLPKEKWWCYSDLYKFEGFWYLAPHLEGALAARSQFEARDDDVILASTTKTGTTWLKAIIPTIFSVADRHQLDQDHDPLLKNHPNELIPSLELQVFKQDTNLDNHQYLSGNTTTPRLFRTLLPYHTLPESVRSSGCKIVYITRDPKDVFVSLFHFENCKERSHLGDPFPMEDLFECFCKGTYPFGPFHDHVLGYWKEKLERPEKILFLRYEELKRDPKGEVRRLATFLGRPLEKEEDVEKVVWRCSLERVKNLDVNKNGTDPWVGFGYGAYFRRGVVGDWKNHLSPEMKERLSEITRTKMEGSGLNLESS